MTDPNMDSPRSVSAGDLSGILKTRVGLILGPGAAYRPSIMGELMAHLADKFSVRAYDSYLTMGDEALDRGGSETDLRSAVRDFFQRESTNTNATRLSHIRWTAVLSACLDDRFDDDFARESARHPLWQPATVISDLRQSLPPRTVPIYRLLGSLAMDNAAVSSADLYKRAASWPQVCRAFADRLQGAPVICLGMSALPAVFWQLLGVLTADPPTSPSALIFVEDDPLLLDSQVIRMCRGRIRLFGATMDTHVLLSTVGSVEDRLAQERLPFPAPGAEDVSTVLHPYRELVSLVNANTESELATTEVHQLHQLLFEPSRPRWDAFVHDLDFRRDVTAEAMAEIELLAQSPTPGSAACLIRGHAACGKTTVMKRLSLDLAKKGLVVLWLRPWFYQDTQAVLFDLFKKLRRALPTESGRPVVFMDDPLTFGTLTAHDLEAAAEAASVDIVLVASARTSDWQTRDARDFVGRIQIMSDLEIADRLTEHELELLPPYLIKLGVAQTAEEARRAVDSAAASGYLATSWRHCIGPCLTRDSPLRARFVMRYFRLGDSAGLTKVFIGALHSNTGVLQEAYGLIAVAEHFRSPVPLEVLVAALDVRYAEWLDAAGSGGAAWGLFYSDYSEQGQTLSYRTRNAIVTATIVRTLNAGELSHGGEFRALRRLLAACTGTAPTYREFCIRILVSTGIDALEYAEGVELFDTAIGALPFRDRTLVHHKALWIKNKGNEPIRAIAVLNEALATPSYPHASHSEADEHIYTSLAATTLRAMQLGELALDDGRRQVLAHLDRAQSKAFFNPNATHVEARLVQGLVEQTNADDPDRNALLTRALRSLDRALTLLRSAQSTPLTRVSVADNISMLETERGKLIGFAKPLAEVQGDAERLWHDNGRQDGFVLAARIMYGDAVQSDRGTDFFDAYSYCEAAFKQIGARNVPPVRDLVEVALDIYYRWRIARVAPTTGSAGVDWQRVKELASQITRGTPTASDPLHEYLYALALSHLGDWGQADAVFGALRRAGLPKPVLWARRDRFLGSDGRPLKVQGTVRQVGDERYLYVESLKVDFRADRTQWWPRASEIAHAFLVFAFGGPTAVKADA